MTKYTTTSLIKELEKFPEDLPIETELALIYNYDSNKVLEEVSCEDYMNVEELYDAYSQYATELAIFEGSWEDDNISDLNNIMPKYVVGWQAEHHCNDNAILKEDIITAFYQLDSINDKKKLTRRAVLFEFMEELGLIESIQEINRKIFAQEKMCKDEVLPLFAPEDGLCFNCDKQIYNRITLEEARNEHITHCPYCSRAYND